MKCNVEKRCGGCQFLDVPYKKQLIDKTNKIKEIMLNVDKTIIIQNCIGMSNPFNYRNKGKYALKNGKMGFYQEGTHQIIYSKCLIQNEKINDIAEYIFELIKKYKINIYNEDTNKGFLRYVIIRYGICTDEIMIIFVTTDGKIHKKDEIIKELLAKYKNIKSIVQNINEKSTNAILGNKIIKLYGSEYIIDKIKINERILKFKISPLSFYQVNSIEMQILYSKAIECAKLNGDEIVYDLYSGIGTISLSIADKVKKVYGIECVKDAVKDAKENARINDIKNVMFMYGKVENLLNTLANKEKANIIFVDPPRSGLDEKTIKTILQVQPRKIIYISCNPVTLAENLKEFNKVYKIRNVQPVDMFPFTKHCEVITLLEYI